MKLHIRLRGAWNALRGRPTMVGMFLRGGTLILHRPGQYIAGNTFHGLSIPAPVALPQGFYNHGPDLRAEEHAAGLRSPGEAEEETP